MAFLNVNTVVHEFKYHVILSILLELISIAFWTWNFLKYIGILWQLFCKDICVKWKDERINVSLTEHYMLHTLWCVCVPKRIMKCQCVWNSLYTVNGVYYKIISLAMVLHSHSQHVSEVDKHSVLREKYHSEVSELTTGGLQ